MGNKIRITCEKEPPTQVITHGKQNRINKHVLWVKSSGDPSCCMGSSSRARESSHGCICLKTCRRSTQFGCLTSTSVHQTSFWRTDYVQRIRSYLGRHVFFHISSNQKLQVANMGTVCVKGTSCTCWIMYRVGWSSRLSPSQLEVMWETQSEAMSQVDHLAGCWVQLHFLSQSHGKIDGQKIRTRPKPIEPKTDHGKKKGGNTMTWNNLKWFSPCPASSHLPLEFSAFARPNFKTGCDSCSSSPFHPLSHWAKIGGGLGLLWYDQTHIILYHVIHVTLVIWCNLLT